MSNRNNLRSWFVIAVGAMLAIVVFVLLATGIFTIENDLVFYISMFGLSTLNLVTLESGVLLSRQSIGARCEANAYLRLALVGTEGILVDLLLAVLFGTAMPVALMIFVALDFFFLALMLGGDALLMTELASRMRA